MSKIVVGEVRKRRWNAIRGLTLTSALPTLRVTLEAKLGPLAEYRVAEDVVQLRQRLAVTGHAHD